MSSEKPEVWWRRISRRMDKASLNFSEQVREVVLLRRDLDEAFYEDLLDVLIGSDIGVELAEEIIQGLRVRVKNERLTNGDEAIIALKAQMLEILQARERNLQLDDDGLNVVLLVGVNGSGKTTTAAKLAHLWRENGRLVLLAAADTYRAAAIEQLKVWADRATVDVISHQHGADPGAVVFDAIQAAQARGVNTVLVDTAGRLHTKSNLMAELQKIKRVVGRSAPDARLEVLLVLEAPTGMNALVQAKAFDDALGLTGLVLTKLDGTAKGGTLLAIESKVGVPVKLVGMGEAINDLNQFDPVAYLDTLFAAALGVNNQVVD